MWTLKLDRKSTHPRYDYFDLTWIGVLSNVWKYICMLALELLCILYTFVCIRDVSDRPLWTRASCVRACMYGKVRGSAAAGWSKRTRSRNRTLGHELSELRGCGGHQGYSATLKKREAWHVQRLQEERCRLTALNRVSLVSLLICWRRGMPVVVMSDAGTAQQTRHRSSY